MPGRADSAAVTTGPLAQAKQLHATGDFAKAVTLLLAYTEGESTDAESWYLLGDSLLQLTQSRESAEALTRAVFLRPDYAEAYGPLGVAQYQVGNLAAAERSFRVAVSFNQNDERSAFYLGALAYQHEDIDQAENWLRRALDQKPNDPLALLYLGLCQQQSKHPDQAAELMRESVAASMAQHRPLAQAFYSLAELNRRTGHNEAALALLEQAATLCPDARTLTLLSDFYKERQRTSDAERVLRQAVSMNPGLPEAHYKLALLFKADAKPEQARAELAAFEQTRSHATFPSVVEK